MVYTINQKVLTLDQFGEDRFLELLKQLRAAHPLADKRNADWFITLPDQYKNRRYLDWFFLMDNDEFVAFSTIQEYNPLTFRCMTRTYVDRNYRSLFSVRDPKAITVTSHFLPVQLEYIGGWKSAFITRQDPKRRRSFERTRGRAEYWTGLQWDYHPNLIKTLNNPRDINAWQNMIYNGAAPDLDNITIEKYYELFPNQK